MDNNNLCLNKFKKYRTNSADGGDDEVMMAATAEVCLVREMWCVLCYRKKTKREERKAVVCLFFCACLHFYSVSR